MRDFTEVRKHLVLKLVRDGRIRSSKVIAAMEAVPRELFVLPRDKKHAYVDTPLSIGSGQTISAPHMVGIMVEELDLDAGQRVLEVGAGSGYHAAVVAEIVGKIPKGRVYSVEIKSDLAQYARENLKQAGYDEVVTVIGGDGSLGYSKQAPYDRIFVTCASPEVPPPLTEQLAENGKLLIPVGSTYYSELTRITKVKNKLVKSQLGGCAFVPMLGEYGYQM
ncbi:protein-L-isoaspartate(D-aspartate) O-methyltransferase [[Eubacterium] cellulosolvens]